MSPSCGSPPPRPFNLDRWAPWILCAAGLIAYANSLGGQFVFDDRQQINSHHFPNAYGPQVLYLSSRPVGYFSFALNHAIHGKQVGGYHVVNLAIHLVAGWLLFCGIRRLLNLAKNANATGLALVSSLWWLVHPLQTQSVTYIIQRYESLAGMFYLACVVLFLKGIERRHWSWYVFSAACCWLGMLSKEILLTAPWLILAFDRVVVPETWRELVVRRGWYYMLLLASPLTLLLRSYDATAIANSNALVVSGLSTWDYARTQPEIILHYVKLSVWPRELCLDYAWPVATEWWQIIPAGVVVFGLLGWTAVLWWRRSFWSLVGIWFYFILATTSSVLVIKDLAVEHRMYLSLATITTLAALGGDALLASLSQRWQWDALKTWRVKITGVALVTVGLTTLTILRNFDYYSYEGIWHDVIAKAPRNGRAYINIGMIKYYNQSEGHLEESSRWLEQGLELDPTNEYGHRTMALLCFDQDRIADALPHIRSLQQPGSHLQATGYTLEAKALRLENKLTEAEKCLKTAYELEPNSAEVKFELARVRIDQQRFAAAEELVLLGLESEPHSAYGHNLLGVIARFTNNRQLAEVWFRRAVTLEPENETYRRNLARAKQGIEK